MPTDLLDGWAQEMRDECGLMCRDVIRHNRLLGWPEDALHALKEDFREWMQRDLNGLYEWLSGYIAQVRDWLGSLRKFQIIKPEEAK